MTATAALENSTTTGTMDRIRGVVEAIDPGMAPEDDAYRASVILVASINVGPNADKIAKLTGYPRSYVRAIGSRLRQNGIWAGDRVCADWLDPEEGWVAFMCDLNVALGVLNRVAA